MMRIANVVAVGAIVLFSNVRLIAEQNWNNWRGPHGNGVANEGQYPTSWSDKESMRWKALLPGRGASTPIVQNGHIYVTSVEGSKNLLLCLSTDGKELWRLELGEAREGKHQKASGANSSPVADEISVFCYFKSGDLSCCDHQGKRLWSVNLQQTYAEDTLWWDLGTSPILVEDMVIVAVMQSGPSYLVAFDRNTGKERWKTDRMMNVNNESNQAYTTPVVAKVAGKPVLLTLGADHLTAHDARSGKELWKLGGFNPGDHQYFRTIASPVLAGDLVICPYARGETLTAVRIGENVSDKNRIAWHHDQLGSDVPTPVVAGERIYLAGDRGTVTCLSVADGKILWRGELPKNRNAYSSSPVLAGGNLYITREDGAVFVVRAGEEFELISSNQIDGSTVSTPVFFDGKILFRTYEALYCIGS